jgi:mono/diheme cytochrome c family protein
MLPACATLTIVAAISEEFVMKQALSPEMPVRVRGGQLRAVTLGIGASALAMACSFGQVDNGAPIKKIDAPTTPAASTSVDPGTVAADPGAATPGTGNNTVAPAPAAPGAGTATTASNGADPFSDTTDLLAQQAKGILQVNCSQCHQGTPGAGNLGYILDYGQLVKQGKIIPGSSADSAIFVRMAQQQMPPAQVTDQRPTLSDIDVVGQWIDSLPKSNLEACTPLQFQSLDQQITAMADDVRNLPNAEDKPFIRYLNLTYVSNAGDCGLTLTRQRYALFKAINSVSTNPVITVPQAIDKDETIYRIDIRDYNWDRPIDLKDVGVVDFNDAWLSLVAAAQPFAIEYTGDQADQLKADTQTAVPFMPVNAFIQASQFGDEYYSLIGGKANFNDFVLNVLKIDQNQDIADEKVDRGGFSGSGVSHQERSILRFDQGVAGGYSLWVSLDFDGGDAINGKANDSIFANPLNPNNAAGEAIFNLPNGMQGYYVSLKDGTRLAQAGVGVVVDPSQNNAIVTNGASCHSCHNAGMISFGDTVRQYVIDNKFDFDSDTFQGVMDTFPVPADMQKLIDRDSAVHNNAVLQTTIPKDTTDPISRVYIDFQLANLPLAQVAGELNVTKDILSQNLQLLDPTLQDLNSDKKGYIERPVLQNVFLKTVCALHSVDENTPVGCP